MKVDRNLTWLRTKGFSLSLVFMIILWALLSGCAEKKQPPPPPVRAIKWMKVTEPSAEQQRHISGVLTAAQHTELSFEVGGPVTQVVANLGDKVNAGQVLARLDPQPFKLRVRDAEAALASVQASQRNAKLEYDRAQLLYQANNTSKSKLDQARAQADSARSQVRAAEARLNLAQRDLRKSVIRAPYKGFISAKTIELAQEIPAGQTVYKIDAEGGFKAELEVPETLITFIGKGQIVPVKFPTLNGLELPGTVSQVGTRAGIGNAFPVHVKLDKTVSQLRPGMTTEVAFTYQNGAETAKGLMIPIAALLAGSDNQHFVFVFDQTSSNVKKTLIQVGELRDNNVEVTSGVRAGDIITTAGVEFLADGQQVTLLQQDKQAAE